MPKVESKEKRQIPSEFAEYFSAPFKGIGPGNIDYYSRLVSSLTDEKNIGNHVEKPEDEGFL